jgi:hypothetical protein
MMREKEISLAQFYRQKANHPSYGFEFSRSRFMPVLLCDDGNRFEGSVGGHHPREELARFYQTRNLEPSPYKTGFRAPAPGSPFIPEELFYRSASQDNVKLIADLLEAGADPNEIPQMLTDLAGPFKFEPD